MLNKVLYVLDKTTRRVSDGRVLGLVQAQPERTTGRDRHGVLVYCKPGRRDLGVLTYGITDWFSGCATSSLWWVRNWSCCMRWSSTN